MLGLRLDAVMEQRLQRFARQTRRSKSDIARDAVREYLERHAADEDYLHQVRAVAASINEAAQSEIEAHAADVLAGEPDYDWGDTAR